LVLVDTTVWIDLLRGTQTAAVSMLRHLLSDGRALVSPVVVQELFHDDRDFDALAQVDGRLRLVRMTAT
jgi:predicted nucleic acid-binding protein